MYNIFFYMLKYLNYYFFVVEICYYVIDLIVCVVGYCVDVLYYRMFIYINYIFVKCEIE